MKYECRDDFTLDAAEVAAVLPAAIERSAPPPAPLSCDVASARCISLRKQMNRTCRPAMYRPGGEPDSEHAAEYPGVSAPFLSPLLHDFPIRGDRTGFCVQVPLGHFFGNYSLPVHIDVIR